jgi:hypothetical protein
MTRIEIANVLSKTLDSVNKRIDRHLKLNKDEQIRQNMLGRSFGLLKVIEFSHRERKITLYKCQCECGNIKNVGYNSLIGGNTSSCGCLRRKNIENSQYKAMFNMYKYSANKRGLEFHLEFSVFKDMTSKNCFYCEASPAPKPLSFQNKKNGITEERTIKVNGIDRVDNDQGYVLQNCVPCCSDCNFMKQDLSMEQFLDKINKIYLVCHKNDT